MPDVDLRRWFRVINPRLKTFGLEGASRREQRVSPWRCGGCDLLLIEFGSGAQHWIRRENLARIHKGTSHA